MGDTHKVKARERLCFWEGKMAGGGGGGGGGSVDRMRSAISVLEAADQSAISELRSSLVMFKMIAEDVEKERNTEAVEMLSQLTKDVISLSDEVAHHSRALQNLSQTYTVKDETTDFRPLIEEHMDTLQANNQNDPENNPFFKQFREAIWKVHHAGELMPGQENEDLILNTQYNVRNFTCPLTGKPISELEDPVRSSECQHIYDRAAVMHYISQHARKRNCPCAVAGCPKPLVASHLVCDSMLKIEIQEIRMRGRIATQAQEVTDYTDLED